MLICKNCGHGKNICSCSADVYMPNKPTKIEMPKVKPPKNEKVKLHQEICQKLNKIYEQKNTDYGDSFCKARKEVQNYTLGKLYDKFERFKQLSKHDNQVKSESIEDTLMDMANYAIMELLERQIESEENNNENK